MPTLQDIRTKVRRLTRSPSTSQVTDAQLDTYINTFILYDFPEHLRLFNLRSTLTFYTRPYIDVYPTNTVLPTDPLYQFTDNYISVHDPVYIGGYLSFFSQSREQFFGIYPNVQNIVQIGVGDGVVTNFTGFLQNTPVLLNNVLFNSIDANNNGLVLSDTPIVANGNSTTVGNLSVPDVVPPNVLQPDNFVNYVTGQYNITFPTPPASGQVVNSVFVPVVVQRAQALLFYDGIFTVRPVPDQVYPVNVEVYQRPTQLLLATDVPQLSEWWQYIAYGAAKKLLEDRMDMETVALIMPEFKTQERLVQRRTLVQLSNTRVATIYTEQVGFGTGGFGWGWGGGGAF